MDLNIYETQILKIYYFSFNVSRLGENRILLILYLVHSINKHKKIFI